MASNVDWDHSDKRNELRTYKDLKLDRSVKSKAGRARTDRKRLYRTIGMGTPDRPYLLVPRSEYLRVWRECHKEMMAKENKSLSDVRRAELERYVYDRLASQTGDLKALASGFRRGHKRDMMPNEEAIYGRALQRDGLKLAVTPTQRAAIQRKMVLHDLLRKIEAADEDAPFKLEAAWKQAVGSTADLEESHLEKIDRQAGLAIVQCVNSSRSFALRRRKDLLPKLSNALGIEIKRIVFR